MPIQATRTKSDVLATATEEFLRTGVAWSRSASTVVFPSKDRSLIDDAVRVLLREVAKAAKRPFIHATSEWYGDRTDGLEECLVTILTIPRLAKLNTVTMGLFMASVENKQKYNRWRADDAVTGWDNKTNHYFQFKGDVGHRIFDAFLEQCTSDPVFRIVLNNTTPITPRVISLAA